MTVEMSYFSVYVTKFMLKIFWARSMQIYFTFQTSVFQNIWKVFLSIQNTICLNYINRWF